MSNNKGFSDTSAARYSLALYELANEANTIEEVERNSIDILKLISKNNDFRSFIKDPTLGQDILKNVINEISKSFNFQVLFKNFLNFLILKRRFFFVDQILKNFNEICSERRGELRTKIISAKELSQNEIDKITEELSNNFKSKIKLKYIHDKSLIGGLVMHVGSTMIDTSIKNKLQQIENRMIEA